VLRAYNAVPNGTTLTELYNSGSALGAGIKFSVPTVADGHVYVGASGAHSTPAFYGRVLNATLGTRMKLVNGYPGMTDGLIAMERGEIDGYPSAFYSALTSTRPNWLRDKLAKAIVQYGPERLGELSGVPFAPDLIANSDDKLLMQAALAPLALGRPLVMPPGVAAERVTMMRKALADTFADTAFKAEAEKIGLIVNAPKTGATTIRSPRPMVLKR
jgi:hypothetical protein